MTSLSLCTKLGLLWLLRKAASASAVALSSSSCKSARKGSVFSHESSGNTRQRQRLTAAAVASSCPP